ncbi:MULTISPECIES: hypothetical protein [unclassified Marinovum]
MRQVDFKRPDGALVAGMGVLIIAAACTGLVMALFMGKDFDLKTNALVLAGFAGACALGYAFLNTWRRPMLSIRPDRVVIPSFFGAKTIPISPGQPFGEFLATSYHGFDRPGTIEGNKFVHFYTLDARGELTKLMALHRDAPEIDTIRRAFLEVAGLKAETLKADKTSRKGKPDIAHWHRR